MSLLNASQEYDSVSPRPRQKQSVQIGNIMEKMNPTEKNRKNKRSSFNRNRDRNNSNNNNRDSNRSADKTRQPRSGRRREGADLGTMPVMLEVDEEDSSMSTSGNRDLHSSSYHTARSASRSLSRSRNGSISEEGADDDSANDVIGGEFSEDYVQLDTGQGSNRFKKENVQEWIAPGFQLDMVPPTPESRIKAVLTAGIDHSGTAGPNQMPSLSLNDDSEQGEEEDAVIMEAGEREAEDDVSEESDFEVESDEDEDDEEDDEDDDDDDDDADEDEDDDEDEDEESDEDDDDDDDEESDEDEESEESSDEASVSVSIEESSEDPSESVVETSEEPSESVDELVGMSPAGMGSNEGSSSEFSSPLPPTTPPPQTRARRMQMQDTTMQYETRDAAPATLQLDSPPSRTQQNVRNRGPGRLPQDAFLQLDAPPTQMGEGARSQERLPSAQNNFSNSLELNAPPAQRTRSRDRIPPAQNNFSNSLELDAPSTQQPQRTRSRDGMPPAQNNFSNSLELDAPPPRQRQRMRSHDTQEEADNTISNSLQLDAPKTQRERVNSHESQDTDEEEAFDTVADLPMPAPRTRTRARGPRQQPKERMMSLDTFAVGNSTETLSVDQTVIPQQQGTGRRRTKAPARIKSIAISQEAKPMVPKRQMPPERRLSLDSRRQVYENNGFNTTSFGQRFSGNAQSSQPSTTPSDPASSPKTTTTKSTDKLEASPDAKNRRRLRSADDLAELRVPDFESDTASSRMRRGMFKRRVSGGRDESPKREKAAYLLGMHKGSVAQGRELEPSLRRSKSPHRAPRGGPVRQPRQRPAPNRFKPLPPPPTNDDLDIDDMIAVRRASAQLSRRVSEDSEETFGDGSADTMEIGQAGQFRNMRQKKRKDPSEQSLDVEQKDPTQVNEKQFWLFVIFLTTLGVIFGFVAVKVS